MSKKFQIIVEDDLLELIEKFSESHCLSRSSAISFLCRQSLNGLEHKQDINNLDSRVSDIENEIAEIHRVLSSVVAASRCKKR